MYLASCYEWKAVLNFHGAVLLEIERGRASWGNSFTYLEARTLHGHLKVNGSVFFCKEFQQGKCRLSRDHKGSIKGESCFVRHICATCWLTKSAQLPQAENSPECPSISNHSSKE